MPSPKVSVIIPVYNAEKTIGHILSKLTAQAYTDIEIIVINDGSSDGSLKILQDAARSDERISIIDQKNGGVSAARNTGIKKANGEFITFIDADDDIDEDLLVELVAMSDKSDFVMCGMQINGRDIVPTRTSLKGKEQIARYVLSSLLTRNLLYGPYCKLFRRSVIVDNNVSFPIGVKYGEDTIFVLSYFRYINTITVIDKALYYYDFQPGGLAAVNSSYAPYYSARARQLDLFVRGIDFSLISYSSYLLLKLRWALALMKNKSRNRHV